MTLRRSTSGFVALPIALFASLWLAARLGAETPESIDHFFRVDARVCTGGQPTPAQLDDLRRDGVRTILSLRDSAEYDSAPEATAAQAIGLRYANIPVRASDPTDEQVVAFLRFTSDPQIFPVFIHCASGNRVGAFWMIRRVLMDGWAVERAEEEGRQIGLRSPNLVEFARAYIRAHAKGD